MTEDERLRRQSSLPAEVTRQKRGKILDGYGKQMDVDGTQLYKSISSIREDASEYIKDVGSNQNAQY